MEPQGVIAGLCAVAAIAASGAVPACDIAVIAIRGEESAWYDVSYIGSAGAFGLLDPAALEVPRFDTGQTLGCGPGRAGVRRLSRSCRDAR